MKSAAYGYLRRGNDNEYVVRKTIFDGQCSRMDEWTWLRACDYRATQSYTEHVQMQKKMMIIVISKYFDQNRNV